MERLYSVSEICDLFRVKDKRTARKIMREMEHIEAPLLVSERAIKAYLQKRTLPPESETRRMMKRKGVQG